MAISTSMLVCLGVYIYSYISLYLYKYKYIIIYICRVVYVHMLHSDLQRITSQSVKHIVI